MSESFDLLSSLAQIAGVFIGFGALIVLSSGRNEDPTMRALLFCSIALLVLGCGSTSPPMHPLVGTWRLEEWRARDSLGVWHREFGDAPGGPSSTARTASSPFTSCTKTGPG